MKKRWNIITLLFSLFLSYGVVKPALAGDPPSRVARLSFVNGEPLFSPAGEKKWVRARLNRPLIAGDKLWSRAHSQAELQLDHATAFLGSETGLALVNLKNNLVQFSVNSGQFALSIRQMRQSQVYKIDTPYADFIIQHPGFYKIVVDNKGRATLFNVKKGRAQTYGNRITYKLYSGKSYRFTGSRLKVQSIILKNGSFDEWCQSRVNRKFSTRYVSTDMIGYEDLDEHGKWVNIKGYGMIWRPEVETDWAPYRQGHWARIEPWGWTWIDNKPWGFAPFHYGRWVFLNKHWYWMPGSVNAKPVYAPALVAFINGRDSRFTLSNGQGGVAWFPLGPKDIYRPSYRVSQKYFMNVNAGNMMVPQASVIQAYSNPNIQKAYTHQHNPQAVTAVPTKAFVQSKNVAKDTVPVPTQALKEAPVTETVSLTPTPTEAHIVDAAAIPNPPKEMHDTAVILQNENFEAPPESTNTLAESIQAESSKTSEPLPVAEPEPTPVAELPVEPEPIAAESEPIAEPEPMPIAEPAPIPMAEQPEPMPIAKPAPMPIAEPAPMPIAEPAPMPIAESAPMPVAEPAPMPEAGSPPSELAMGN